MQEKTVIIWGLVLGAVGVVLWLVFSLGSVPSFIGILTLFIGLFLLFSGVWKRMIGFSTMRIRERIIYNIVLLTLSILLLMLFYTIIRGFRILL